MRAFLAGLISNLRVGFRVATFRRVEASSVRATVGQLVAMVCIDLGVMGAYDWMRAAPDGTFNLWRLPGALFYLPLLLLASYLVGRRGNEGATLLSLSIVVIAAGQYVTLAHALLFFAGERGWLDDIGARGYSLLRWGLYAWTLLSTVFAVVCLTQRSMLARVPQVAAFAVVLFVPLWFLPRAQTGALWIAEDTEPLSEEEEARYYAVASEPALYLQPVLLDTQLNALAPERPGVEDVYFVGVAGYADEDVFSKEMRVIRALFEERFDTQDRSIALVNNPDTVLQLPIATVTSLQRTLEHVGQLMNPDEDVLVLYLTSHGSEDHRFALEFEPLRLRDLDPQTLREALDAAGIRWRIIVVSACYSGGFIEPLRDERTLIVTAADAHSQSFGCGAASDFTYFSKAYVDEALRETHSLTEAFALAKQSIEMRERTEGLTPSHPQLFVGQEMAKKLHSLERRWNRAPVVQVRAP